MLDCNSVSTPCEKTSYTGEVEKFCNDQVSYGEAVGSLMFLCIGSRPDIAYVVSRVSSSLEKPTDRDWSNVKRIMRYIKGTMNFGILYKSDSKNDVLHVYCDSDHSGDPKTYRSTTGVVTIFAEGPISWLSKRQTSVALSTTEAEFVAACEAAKEAIWLNRLLREITVLSSVPVLHIDNMSAIKLIKNPIFHKRTKHINIRFFFVREKFFEKELAVEHIAGTDQLADVLTKALSSVRFADLRLKIGLINFSSL